jgi:hypothetical protein
MRNFAFCGCSKLTKVTISNGIRTIEHSTFKDCTSLTSVTIPDSVTMIGDNVFYNCSSLINVYCKATNPPFLSFDAFLYNASDRKIYVPMQSVEQYKMADGWKKYKKHIVGYDFK